MANAIGSARSVTEPSAPCTRNLYSPPIGKPGQNNSHTPGRPEHPQLGLVAVPVVELADQADALGVRRPHRERHPVDHAVGRGEAARMRAEDLPQSFVAALGEQVQVDLAERGQEAVRVGDGVDDGESPPPS